MQIAENFRSFVPPPLNGTYIMTIILEER